MTFRLPIALALIDQHHCPCRNCNGQLATCEWPTWRRCVTCRCCWKADEIRGKRYACRTRDDSRLCPAQAEPEPQPIPPSTAHRPPAVALPATHPEE